MSDRPGRVIRLAGDEAERAAAYGVRSDVFVTEQGVPADLELDDLDDTADHFVAYDDGRAVGAGRLVVERAGLRGCRPGARRPVGHLGRLAVRPETRGTGLGRRPGRRDRGAGGASAACGSWPSRRRPTRSASTSGSGYAAYGPVFDDAGLPHRWMTKVLTAS